VGPLGFEPPCVYKWLRRWNTLYVTLGSSSFMTFCRYRMGKFTAMVTIIQFKIFWCNILLHVRFPWWHDLCTLLHFHSNVTLLLHNNGFVAVTQQCKRKHYYGYGDVRDFNWTGQLSSGTRRYRTRRGWTRVLSVVINSCVLNLECNKVPSWNRTYENVTICTGNDKL
jgi:hypothetical protein